MATPSRHRLFFHPASSASMRVTLYLACRGVPQHLVEKVSTGLTTDHRGIMVFTMPDGDVETEKLGTTDLTAFNPEGRIPVLLLPDGRKLTQSGPIIDYIEAQMPPDTGRALMPSDPWLRAQASRIIWIVASDTQPYQNIPFIIQAMGEWGMVKASPTEHPLRLHFIRREFGAIERILTESAGTFAVGDDITLADCFLVPQVRNALLAGIDLTCEFPILSRVFEQMLGVPAVAAVIEEAGGVVQPLVFDAEQFAVYAAHGENSTSGAQHRFDVFGRELMVARESARWVAYDVSGDGKRRRARDIQVPAELTVDELAQYLGDLCHERATPRHPQVRSLD